MKKARLITTLECPRNCEGCCNTQSMIKSATVIENIEDLKSYNEINITGGEPVMFPEKLIKLLKRIYKFKPNPTMYLYMSICNVIYDYKICSIVDGINYTIHSECTPGDISMFVNYQESLRKYEKIISKRS